MIKKFLYLLLIILFIETIVFAELIDVIYLKDGMVVKGVIKEHIMNKYVKIVNEYGDIKAYKTRDIEKIIKKEYSFIKKSKKAESKAITHNQIMRYIDKEKNGAAAFLWSFFILPGAGHWYCGEVGYGFIFLGIDLLAIICMIELGTTTYYNDYYDYNYDTYYWGGYSYRTAYSKLNEIFYISLFTLLFSRIFEWVDCFNASTRYNKKVWKKLGMPENINFSLNLKPNNDFINTYAGLNYHF